jgi:hypothetical protein
LFTSFCGNFQLFFRIFIFLPVTQHHGDNLHNKKLFGQFYFNSNSASAEDVFFLRVFQAISGGDIGTLHHCVGNTSMNVSTEKYGISLLEFAAVAGSPSVFSVLLDKGCSYSSSQSIASPLHFATAFGRADIVELIVSLGYDP